MNQGLFDKRAATQVIGSIMHKPDILSDVRYKIELDDFAENFHQICFSAISNLFETGVSVIDVYSIDALISNYPVQYKIFTDNNGIQYVQTAYDTAEVQNFDYNYQRLKKGSLLRFYESKGIDTRIIFDNTLVDPKELEAQQRKFNTLTLKDIISQCEGMYVTDAQLKFLTSTDSKGQAASKGMRELKQSLKEEPDFGIPVQSKIITTLSRGSRKGKLYMRSSNSGGG